MSIVHPQGTTQISLLGMVVLWAGTDIPTDWAACDGSAWDRSAYSPLFAVIGTTFGAGDGSTTFNLPDFRGRSPMGVGTGLTAEGGTTGTARSAGARTGAETHTLSIAQMPAHTHTYQSDTVQSDASISLLGSGNRVTAQPTTATSSAGTGSAHNNVHPVQVIQHIIRVNI